MRFRTLLTFAILLPLLVTGLAVMLQMYATADRNATDVGRRLLNSVTAEASQQLNSRSRQAVNLVESLQGLSSDGLALQDTDRLVGQLLAVLRANQGITWISYSNTAGEFTGVYRDPELRLCTNQSHIVDGKTWLVEYRVADDESRELINRNPDSGYDPRIRPFYIKAAGAPGIVWSEPYVFYNQRIPGISCSIALRSEGKLTGVISVDYDLRYLSQFARQARTSENSRILVFDQSQILIAHSDAAVIRASGGTGQLVSLSDVREPVTESFLKAWTTLGINGENKPESRSLAFEHGGSPHIASVQPMALESGPVYYVATIAPKREFAPSPWALSRNAFIVVSVVVILGVLVALQVAKSLSSPLVRLMQASQRIGKGDLDVSINLGRLHEYHHLAGALQAMQSNLRDWIRVRSSLNLAMEIQRRLLPAAPPKVPVFDIAGYSVYCDETGGDYFDYLLIDQMESKQLLVALGDVMGHGLPSALLMAGARGILRASTGRQMTPAALLSHMNKLLHHDTHGKSFMTMFLARFDLRGEICTWASAGHDPLLIYDPVTKVFYEPEGGDIPLGIMDEADYADYRFEPIASGQIIFMGSDGVWEMANEEGDRYGKERLKDVLSTCANCTAEEIKEGLLRSLVQFRGNAQVKDDVTFVILKRV